MKIQNLESEIQIKKPAIKRVSANKEFLEFHNKH